MVSAQKFPPEFPKSSPGGGRRGGAEVKLYMLKSAFREWLRVASHATFRTYYTGSIYCMRHNLS